MDVQRVFAIYRLPLTDLKVFEQFCRAMSRLKSYGRVQVDIASVTGIDQHEMPNNRSSWHEYTRWLISLFNIFPHPKAASHIPDALVKRNRDLVLAKAAIVRQCALEVFFQSQEPHFMPESFFREFPHLRGPRIDHPRRSNHEEFSLCTDLPETLEMYEWSMAQFKKAVPELACFQFNTNDAGGGFCWAAAQYAGPNGPKHCRHRNAGERVRGFLDALNRGAEAGGGKVELRIDHANFWNNERELVRQMMPPNAQFSDGIVKAGINEGTHPVRAFVDPVGIASSIERFRSSGFPRLHIPVGAPDNCGYVTVEALERAIDVIEESLRTSSAGVVPKVATIRKVSTGWAGEKNADELTDAFFNLNNAIGKVQMLAPFFGPIVCGVTMRFTTRPLVFNPELLTKEEESYFLPYIFNTSEQEARSDYNDCHGGKLPFNVSNGSRSHPALLGALDGIVAAAKRVEKLSDAAQSGWLRQLALSARMWASMIRSCHNFYFAQLIRDAKRAVLLTGIKDRPKEATFSGDADLLPWNELMRDEYDNANELLAMLKTGGAELISRASEPNGETSFLLGPDVIGAVTKKLEIMRAHWLDVEKYLATPHK
ncbi:MAG TPA: hypothetical protein VEJ63_06705 [Planctomycetota bacterium]|nr:hypothetical protein [Planctomycetota bacterium]